MDYLFMLDINRGMSDRLLLELKWSFLRYFKHLKIIYKYNKHNIKTV